MVRFHFRALSRVQRGANLLLEYNHYPRTSSQAEARCEDFFWGPKTHPKSRNTKKSTAFTRTFSLSSRELLPSSLWSELGTCQSLFRWTFLFWVDFFGWVIPLWFFGEIQFEIHNIWWETSGETWEEAFLPAERDSGRILGQILEKCSETSFQISHLVYFFRKLFQHKGDVDKFDGAPHPNISVKEEER